ncbi:MAG: hypothetical protein AAF485_27245 [Chloroflexota bacterium]
MKKVMYFKKLLLITFLVSLVLPHATLVAQTDENSEGEIPDTPITCADVYTAQSNDWLSKIADKFLGDIEAYTVIVSATNQMHQTDDTFPFIESADAIDAGWKLCIPANPDAEILYTETTATASAETPAGPPVAPTERYTLNDFSDDFNFSYEHGIKPKWIFSTPETVEQDEIAPDLQRRFDNYGYRSNYLWNEHLETTYFVESGIFPGIPPDVELFEASWDTTFPRFRYPPNTTLPSGITTNQFGWRGPLVRVNKPKNTIRIACVGASTTVSGHTFPFSYPELLEHWLNLWSEESGLDVKFEVLNLGREGLTSHDIEAVVRYEALPMEIDYLIYYEGSNQFDPRSMVTFPADVTYGQPPKGVAPNFDNIESTDKSLLDYLAEYSALADRVRSIVEISSFTGLEPPKPKQTLNFPEGINEFQPKREFLGSALALNKILGNLDAIKQDVDKQDVRMFVSTFDWFVYEGMVLDPDRHRNLYGYINRVYWPVSYANMRRMADFQNRVFTTWAASNQVDVIDVAGQMPRQPDLYDDAIHNTPLGIRARAWINFETLVPILLEDIEQGKLPRSDEDFVVKHPYIDKGHYETVELR